ncbi:MAG TPA: AMP-binding protein [Thermoleophilaceae bacterium]|nr:AMP-binding protein [Thermoleophilaceae bacterium]
MISPDKAVKAGEVLIKAGVLRIERPDTAVKSALKLLDWGMTPAAAFQVSAERFGDEPALIDEKGTLTFDEVHKRTNALANAFREEGIEPDDSVAIMCRDHRWFVETTVALSKLGATALLYNTAFAGPQLEEVTEREKPAAIVYDDEFSESVEGAKGDRKLWKAWQDDDGSGDDTIEKLIEQGDDSDLDSPDSPGKITLLTSGSTGTPKGASRSSPNAIEAVLGVLSRIPLHAREPTVFGAPLFHAWGFLQFNLGLLLSSTYVLRRKFDPEATLAAVDEHKATALVIVPVMLQRILELDEDARKKYDTASLRVVAASGGAMPGELAEKWMDEFGDNLYNLYGSTEVAWAAIATPEDLRAAPGTSGPPAPGTTIKILDEDKNEVDNGESGEIFVANEMLFEGYTGDEEDEEMVDGHMTTGDLGHLDEEGRLFVEGRSDNMIVSGGENVYPEEVQETLEEHQNVSEAAVIGVEDEEFGERLKAFVVKEGDVSEDDLKSHVKEKLAKYKVPREIEFIDELPRKPQGKVDTQALEEREEEEQEGDDSGGDDSGDGGSGNSGSDD